MADGEATAGTVISDISPVLGAVPYVGPILSAAASIGGGLLQSDAAKKQAAEAAKIRQDALNTQVQPLRPEYLAALHLQQMRSLGGLPGLQTDKTDLAQQLADQIRYIRMAAPGGNQALAAMSKAVATNSTGLNRLQAEDLRFRNESQTGVVNALNTLGAEGVTKEGIRDTQRTQGLTAAAAMENASMLNKQDGYDQAAKGLVGGTNSLFQNLLKVANIPASGTNTTGTKPIDWTGSTSADNIGVLTPNQQLHQYLSTSAPGAKLDSAGLFNGMGGGNNTASPSDSDNTYYTPEVSSPASLGVMDY